MVGHTNIITCSVKTEKAEHTCTILNKIISKFVAKLVKYKIRFKGILTFLGLDNRDTSLKSVYLIVNQYSKKQINKIIILHKKMLLKR